MKLLVNLDLSKNELQNARIQNLASAPGSPVEGQIYYHTGDKKFYIWNGTAWDTWGDSGNADTLDGEDGTFYLDRANHTGTQLASTISDFDTQVQTSRLDQMAAPTADVDINGQKLINVAAPSAGTDAANKQYVDNAIQGVDAHASVRAATVADITLSGTQTVDTVALIAGDRVLVKNQADASENGLYVVAAGAWARAADADSWDEFVSAFVFVEEGSLADTSWLSTVDAGGTLDTDDITFVQFGHAASLTASNLGAGAQVFSAKVGNDFQFRSIEPGSAKVTVTQNADDIEIDVDAAEVVTAVVALGVTRKYAVSVGNGVLTDIAVVHNLNTTDVIVQVKEVAGGLAVVYADVVITDANTVTVTFAIAPTTDQYRVIVIG